MARTDDVKAVVAAAIAANPTLSASAAVRKFFEDHADNGGDPKAAVGGLDGQILWLIRNP